MDKPIPHLIASAIIARLREAGFTVRSDRGKLKVAPISDLPAELKEELITNRVAVLDALEREIDAQAREDAVIKEACADDPFADEGASPVQLVSYDLVKMSSDGEPVQYQAFPPGYLDSVREFAAVEKKHAEEKARKQAEREKAKARKGNRRRRRKSG